MLGQLPGLVVWAFRFNSRAWEDLCRWHLKQLQQRLVGGSGWLGVCVGGEGCGLDYMGQGIGPGHNLIIQMTDDNVLARSFALGFIANGGLWCGSKKVFDCCCGTRCVKAWESLVDWFGTSWPGKCCAREECHSFSRTMEASRYLSQSVRTNKDIEGGVLVRNFIFCFFSFSCLALLFSCSFYVSTMTAGLS